MIRAPFLSRPFVLSRQLRPATPGPIRALVSGHVLSGAALLASCAFLSCALSGCAASANYPSLATRPVEKIGQTATPAPDESAPTIAPPAPSADLQTRLSGLVTYAQKSDAQFRSLRDGAQATIAAGSGAAVTSDSWSSAQVALAQLDAARSGAASALADLDVLYSDARDASPVNDTPRITAIVKARATVQAIVAQENATTTSLAAKLKS